MNNQDLSNEAKAMLVLGSFQTGDSTAIESYVSADKYIQHNLGAPDGRAALISMIPGASKDGNISIRRVLVMGDLVALHNDYNLPAFGGALVGFDVFRFKDGKIVEHWDNLMPRVNQRERAYGNRWSRGRDEPGQDTGQPQSRGGFSHAFLD